MRELEMQTRACKVNSLADSTHFENGEYYHRRWRVISKINIISITWDGNCHLKVSIPLIAFHAMNDKRLNSKKPSSLRLAAAAIIQDCLLGP